MLVLLARCGHNSLGMLSCQHILWYCCLFCRLQMPWRCQTASYVVVLTFISVWVFRVGMRLGDITNQRKDGSQELTNTHRLEAQRERKRSVEWISFWQPFHAKFGLDLWLCVNEAETVSFISFLCQLLFTPLHCAQSQVNKEMDYIELLWLKCSKNLVESIPQRIEDLYQRVNSRGFRMRCATGTYGCDVHILLAI